MKWAIKGHALYINAVIPAGKRVSSAKDGKLKRPCSPGNCSCVAYLLHPCSRGFRQSLPE